MDSQESNAMLAGLELAVAPAWRRDKFAVKVHFAKSEHGERLFRKAVGI